MQSVQVTLQINIQPKKKPKTKPNILIYLFEYARTQDTYQFWITFNLRMQ